MGGLGWEERNFRSVRTSTIVIGKPQNINDRVPLNPLLPPKTSDTSDTSDTSQFSGNEDQRLQLPYLTQSASELTRNST